ncbi:Rrf2 family transcriptional regulator [Flavobacterium agricola]|uniref:Rrf2 family transcriptional regulator n=1 Tax=Flavobacterium agricola TaxID=2870839 RepID=A0ABY6M2F1_9FLAO|nr:Rrf2 family transcriptional regulator [Flavobacterium agricola]UYW01453.1 Rrf2 family transcriptional regulator [Flavobacterium agricola]
MFSKTCEYAIRALIYIAQQSKDGLKVSIKDISLGIDSPEHFIAKILQQLSRKGFVKSVKGPNGGFYMEADELKINLATVVREIDGDRLFTGCGLGLKACSELHPCPIHNDFKIIKENLMIMLESSQIKFFVDNLESNLTFLKC